MDEELDDFKNVTSLDLSEVVEGTHHGGKAKSSEVVSPSAVKLSQHDESNAEDSTNIKEWVCVMCGYKATQKGNVIEHVHRNHLKGNFSTKTETFEELTEAAIIGSIL